MVKARKRSELNPDPYTFNVNNSAWCSAFCRWYNQIKKIMQARIQTSASALGSKQTISSFKSFEKGKTETIRGQVVFLFIYFFTFSFSDVIELTFQQKANQAWSMHSCKYFSGVISHLWIFMSWLWRRSMNLNKVIYFIQDLENTRRRGLNL